MNSALINETESIIALRREKALKNAETAKAALYDAEPELYELDRIINLAGAIRGFAIHSVQIPPRTKAMAESVLPAMLTMDTDSLDALIADRQLLKEEILGKAGVSQYAPDYTCKICSDTGRLSDGRRCTCFRRILARKLTEESNLPGENARFSLFNLNCYPEKSRARMANVLQAAVDFTADFGNKEVNSLLFIGDSGVGKTFLAECIANELLDRGIPVLYMPVSTLYTKLSRLHFATGEEQSNLMRLKDTVLTVELLIIDDLGTEKMTESRYEELLEILNTRESGNTKRTLKTIITTNLTPQKIFDIYGERIGSRLFGNFDVLKFEGDDIRLQNKLGRA